MRFGAIILQRARPQSTPFVFNANTGDPIIDPANYVFPFRAGVDVGLLRRGERADIDFRYFGVNQWSTSQGPINAGPGASLAGPSFGGGSADPLTISSGYTSTLQSVESNLRKNVSSRLTFLGGFRYLQLRDRLSLTAQDFVNPDTTQLGFNTTNNLYGAQIGADAILWDNGDRFRIEGVIKTGIFANSASSTFTLNDSGGGGGSLTSNRTRPAFVGDLNFTGIYQISDRWALRGGYQLLWLSGVAVATEQLNNINLNGGGLTTNTSHGAFFHGATIGLERSW